MPSGKPGEHPLTDILVHSLPVYSEKADAIVRELSFLMAGDELESIFDWSAPPPVEQLEQQLHELLIRRRDQDDQKSTAVAERRKAVRIPVEFATMIHVRNLHELDPPQIVTAKDLSQGGMFLESDVLFEPGHFIEFDLELPDGRDAVDIVAVVRRCSKTPPMGMGVEFIHVDSLNLARLFRFIDHRNTDQQDAKPAEEG